MINRNRLVQTFLDLVQIDSPSYFEDEICEDLKKRLRSLDLEVETGVRPKFPPCQIQAISRSSKLSALICFKGE